MKQIPLEPYKPKNIETTIATGVGFGDLPYYQDAGVRITYWKCNSIIGRLLFLFTGKIQLKQITTIAIPQAIVINVPEPTKE